MVKQELFLLIVRQSKGKDGRIHCVDAGEFILLSCERNPGSEENYCGAKGEMVNLPVFTYIQTVQVSTHLRYHLNVLGNFLYLCIVFFRIQFFLYVSQFLGPMQITYVSCLLSVRITNLNLIT